MKKSLFALTLAGLLLFSQNASAAARTWELDTDHSNVYFSIEHIYAKVQGRFTAIAATVHFDPANLKESRFDFEIKVDSIDTGINQRDDHLRSADFFASSDHPLITFTSNAVTAAGEGVYQVAGTLTVKGKSRDLVLPLTFAGIKDHPAAPGKQVAGFNGRLSVDRLALGVGDGKFHQMGLLGKEVEVLVTLELLADKKYRPPDLDTFTWRRVQAITF